jgi:hypothetical protein
VGTPSLEARNIRLVNIITYIIEESKLISENTMIVLFHEDVLLLSTYKFIVIPIKYHNFGALVYDSAENQMLNAISLVVINSKCNNSYLQGV